MTRHFWTFTLGLPLLVVACGPAPGTGDATASAATAGTSSSSSGGVTGDVGTNSTSAPTGLTGSGAEGCEPSCEPDIPAPNCDVFGQDCPDGEKCIGVYNDGWWDTSKCVEVSGDKQPGEPCTVGPPGSGIDDCAKGAFCWIDDAENQLGHCSEQCSGSRDAPVCSEGSDCLIDEGGYLNICPRSCDPLLQDCVDEAQMCTVLGDSAVCAPDKSGEEGQVNDPCAIVSACDKGLACIDAVAASAACDPQGMGCCQPFCKLPDAPCPNPDQACVQWFDPMSLPPGDPRLEIGVCAIPGWFPVANREVSVRP